MDPADSSSHHWEIDGPSPPFPYVPGFSIKIRPYTSPTEADMQAKIDAEKSLKARYPPGTHKISPIEYSITQPYCQVETELATETSLQAREYILHVDSIVTRPASDIFWNLFQCHLDNDNRSRCTAKIYDPVYSSCELLAHIHANNHIANEAGAYDMISEASISGKVTPLFLGVWVMEVPVPGKDFGGVDYVSKRSVPLLLFEAIEAADLASTYLRSYYTSGYVEPEPHLPQAWRREVLARIYEAKALLSHAGVNAHVRPDGVFVKTTGLENERPDVRVVIANLERVSISETREQIGGKSGRPTSPIEIFWDDVLYGMQYLAWDEELEDYRKWLVQRWGASTEYRPLSEHLQKRIARGGWGEVAE